MAAPNYNSLEFNLAPNFITASLDPGGTVGIASAPLPKWTYPGGVLNPPALKFLATPVLGFFNILGLAGGTLTTGTFTTTIDLTAMKDPYGVTSVSFANVMYWAVLNMSTTPGNNLLVGGAVTTPWLTPFNGVGTTKLTVPAGNILNGALVPGLVLMGGPNIANYAVGSAKNLLLDAGAFTIPYQVLAIGIST